MNRIAIDVDEVLVPFLSPMARYHKQKSGMTAINFIGTHGEDVYPWCEESDISIKGWGEL